MPMNQTQPITRRILRLDQIKATTGLSRTSIYELMSRGLFPKGKPIAGLHAVGWDSSEVETWINQQLDNQ
jgi:prophage regulatory protein